MHQTVPLKMRTPYNPSMSSCSCVDARVNPQRVGPKYSILFSMGQSSPAQEFSILPERVSSNICCCISCVHPIAVDVMNAMKGTGEAIVQNCGPTTGDTTGCLSWLAMLRIGRGYAALAAEGIL
jgi:hypothetical protein